MCNHVVYVSVHDFYCPITNQHLNLTISNKPQNYSKDCNKTVHEAERQLSSWGHSAKWVLLFWNTIKPIRRNGYICTSFSKVPFSPIQHKSVTSNSPQDGFFRENSGWITLSDKLAVGLAHSSPSPHKKSWRSTEGCISTNSIYSICMWSRLRPCSNQLYNLKVTVTHTQSSDTSAAKQLNHNSIKPFKALSKHFLLPSKVRHKQICTQVPEKRHRNSKFFSKSGCYILCLFVNSSILLSSAKNNSQLLHAVS